MNWIALRMLVGNPGKYLSMILGVAFASLLISQQASIFVGLMRLTASQIRDIQGANIWVMDPNVQFIDDIKPMSENDLYRVRSVPGVEWAVKLYKGLSRARLPDGSYQQTILIGLDDASLVGAPQRIFSGKLTDLRQPDAVIVDRAGAKQLWPDDPFRLGRTFEMNDRRAVVVGFCEASRTFQTFPIVYARYSQAIGFVPQERKVMSFILAQSSPGVDSEVVCQRIEKQTGLQAQRRDEFTWTTIWYYMEKTGIPINFGITVLLGFAVGTAIVGQTFYLFTVENIRQFGTLKALGVTNFTLMRMIMLQAVVVGLLGYCLGVGAASLFGYLTESAAKLAFYMPWQIPVATAVAVLLIIVLTSLFSLRRVLTVDPATVFQGG
ncbi:MAG: FtsX-like permease family protein [Pirellulales bacterium]|nr:FtsX-like permease family protein [Pirellulales bacterium]